MAKNTKSSQGHRRHDKNSIGGGGRLLAKSKWNKSFFVIPLWQRGKAYEFIHFLLCDYWVVELAQILISIMSFRTHMIEKLR